MDTSKEYVEMCRKAVEIQQLKQYVDGCYYSDVYSGKQYVSIVCNSCEIEYGGDMEFSDTAVWLPRQDQLQEIMDVSGIDDLESIFHAWYQEILIDKGYKKTTFEQLWLAFVMKEKFNKIWNGKDWLEVR